MVKKGDFLNTFSKVNILVVGDVMIDRYLNGDVNRVSPEAPVPVVHLQEVENRLGGAANVALNLKALGATPYLCSVIGKDDNAAAFLKLLPKNNLSTRGIIQSEERKTTVKTRVLAQNQHLLRVDTEDTHDLSTKERNTYLEVIRDILDIKDIHAILFQDYNKGVLCQKTISEIVLEAVKRDIPTAVDPKNHNFWAYKHVTLFKPNLKEIRAQLPFQVDTNPASLRKAASAIQEKIGNQITLITLSEAGLFIANQEEQELVPTQARSIADVCGAGDTVISVATIGIALGMSLLDIATLSNLAGGQVCEKVGVVPVDATQLKAEYESLQKSVQA